MRRSRTNSLWPALPAMVFLAGAFLWPMARLCVLARGGLGPLFLDHYNRRALVDSIVFSLAIAAASTVICLPAALALARGRFTGRAILRGVFALPLSLSGVIVGFLTVAMLGQAGALPSLFHWESLRGSAFGLGGLAIAYLYFEIPRATLTMESALAAVDDGVIDAARTLGAGRWQLVRLVWLPLCAPALRAAFGVTFAASIGSFGVALILSARFPLLPVELYQAFAGTLDDALAAAMAVALALIAAAVLFLVRR